MPFARVYPLYLKKVERKGRSKEEVDALIFWLTGYGETSLEKVLEKQLSMADFFEQAPAFNPKANLIKGTICGVRVEAIEDPLMQKIRYLVKIIDELARGKHLDKIRRV